MDYNKFKSNNIVSSQPGNYSGLNNIFEQTKYKKSLDKVIHRDEFRFSPKNPSDYGIPGFGYSVIPTHGTGVYTGLKGYSDITGLHTNK